MAIDLFSRRVVGSALGAHIRVQVVEDALQMALGRRQPPAGLIHRCDRGRQYVCLVYQKRLDGHNIRPSMSGKGDCWDNAPVERFFGSLKRERTDHIPYPIRQTAKADVIDYIEMFYNSNCRHSYLGYLCPLQYESRAGAA